MPYPFLDTQGQRCLAPNTLQTPQTASSYILFETLYTKNTKFITKILITMEIIKTNKWFDRVIESLEELEVMTTTAMNLSLESNPSHFKHVAK